MIPKNKNIISETWNYFKVRKEFWLLPTTIMLFIAGILIIFGRVTFKALLIVTAVFLFLIITIIYGLRDVIKDR